MAANPSARASAPTCRTPAGLTSRTRTNQAWTIRFPETRWTRCRLQLDIAARWTSRTSSTLWRYRDVGWKTATHFPPRQRRAGTKYAHTCQKRGQDLGRPAHMLRTPIRDLVPARLLRNESVVLLARLYGRLQGAEAQPLDFRQVVLGAVQRATALGAKHPSLVGAGPEFLQVFLSAKDVEFRRLHRRHGHERAALALLALAAMAHGELVDLAVVPVFDAPTEAAT